ncbi:MAG: type II toxin-antitoxin system HigA family antitoxin [Kiritimatiellia bacterium]
MRILKKLLQPFQRKIKTDEEYAARMAVFSALMDKGESLTEDEADYMELLGTLLSDYEHTVHPEIDAFVRRPVTPVEAIQWALDRHGLRQKDLCPYIGSEQLVSAVLNGTRGLSKAMMMRLHDGLGIPYEDLMGAVPSPPRVRRVAAVL